MNNRDELLSKIEILQKQVRLPLFPGATPLEIERLLLISKRRLGICPPIDYLEFLKIHDGLTVEGIFFYSTTLLADAPEEKGLSFILMNVAHRELEWKSDYIFLGDDDLDVFIFNTKSLKYEVRDKQSLDNLFEDFDSFSKLLDHILQRIEDRI
uniref:YrhA family protein n=1 Tax=Pseudomonas sp. RW407 TaxID=2202894 RepID=UPI0011B7B336|nr:YrhA family protein [Pseudomonas sp. RW407]